MVTVHIFALFFLPQLAVCCPGRFQSVPVLPIDAQIWGLDDFDYHHGNPDSTWVLAKFHALL
jgi:hypothetical protein